jgi:hypothetical protein
MDLIENVLEGLVVHLPYIRPRHRRRALFVHNERVIYTKLGIIEKVYKVLHRHNVQYRFCYEWL